MYTLMLAFFIALVVVVSIVLLFMIFPNHLETMNHHLDNLTDTGCCLPSEIRKAMPNTIITNEIGAIGEIHYLFVLKACEKRRVIFINLGMNSLAFFGNKEFRVEDELYVSENLKILSGKIPADEEVKIIVIDRDAKRPTLYVGSQK
jgi:hypothetical protein